MNQHRIVPLVTYKGGSQTRIDADILLSLLAERKIDQSDLLVLEAVFHGQLSSLGEIGSHCGISKFRVRQSLTKWRQYADVLFEVTENVSTDNTFSQNNL